MPELHYTLDLYEKETDPKVSVLRRKRDGKSIQNLMKMHPEKLRKVLEKQKNEARPLPMCGTDIDPDTGESYTCLMAPLG